MFAINFVEALGELAECYIQDRILKKNIFLGKTSGSILVIWSATIYLSIWFSGFVLVTRMPWSFVKARACYLRVHSLLLPVLVLCITPPAPPPYTPPRRPQTDTCTTRQNTQMILIAKSYNIVFIFIHH